MNTKIEPEMLKPKANRKLGDILIVLDKEHWDGPIDKSLNEHFCDFILSTPGPWDQEFDLKYIDPKGFNGMTNTDNTILFFNIDEDSRDRILPFFSPIKDNYAKGQIIFDIPSMNKKNVLLYIDRYADSIKKIIKAEYLSILTSRLEENAEINKLLNKNHNVSLLIPRGMKVIKSNSEFTMLGKSKIKKDDLGDHEIQQRLFIYSYPYNNKSLFTQKRQIHIRDSVCKIHVKGRLENSYMETQKNKSLPFISKSLLHDNNYVLETRGSWRVRNDRMGGAFISIAVHDKHKNRIVTIEGNVYAPRFSKRELIREMEALIYSYDFNPQ